MAVTNDPEDARAEHLDDPRVRTSNQEESPTVQNKYLAFAGMFENDPFMDELEAYIETERRRQRDEAARLADLEDEHVAAEKEGLDMTTTGSFKNVPVVTPVGTYGGSWATQDESDPEYNPYVALAGIFKDDPFAAEVEAHWRAERQRERDEAARLADLEDAARAGAEADQDQAGAPDAIADAS